MLHGPDPGGVHTPHLIRTPRSVDINITGSCNFRCRYCYHFSGPGDVRKDLPAEEWYTFFNELRETSVMEVCIAGGEPFIREDITGIIDAIVQNRMRFSILSNGSLITPEHAERIATTHRCNYVQVSIDGASPQTHDVFRGKGSFEKAINGIKILNDHHIRVTSRVTVHPKNVDELDQIANFLLNDLGLHSFSTNYVTHQGQGEHNSDTVGLTTPDLIKAMQKLVRLSGQYPGRISATAGPLADARMFRAMEEARLQGCESSDGGGYLTGCGCSWSRISVRADGIIIPCTMLSHIELGRINEDSLIDIWNNHPVLHQLRYRRTIPLTHFEECHNCAWVRYCTGNCPATGYTMAGDINHPSPQGCLKRFMESGGRIFLSDESYQ